MKVDGRQYGAVHSSKCLTRWVFTAVILITRMGTSERAFLCLLPAIQESRLAPQADEATRRRCGMRGERNHEHH